jgi:hypothetical protein
VIRPRAPQTKRKEEEFAAQAKMIKAKMLNSKAADAVCECAARAEVFSLAFPSAGL